MSYFTARPSRDIIIAGHQEATRDLWPDLTAKYETYISAIVYEEAGKGDPDQAKMRLAAIETFPMLDIDEDARFLAERIIAGKGHTGRLSGRCYSYCSGCCEWHGRVGHMEFRTPKQPIHSQGCQENC